MKCFIIEKWRDFLMQQQGIFVFYFFFKVFEIPSAAWVPGSGYRVVTFYCHSTERDVSFFISVVTSGIFVFNQNFTHFKGFLIVLLSSPCFQDSGSHSKPKIVYSFKPGNGPCVRDIHNEFEFEPEQSGCDVSSTVIMVLPTALITVLYTML